MWVKMLMMVTVVMMISVSVESSQTMMKDMTKNFLQAYMQCQQELGTSDAVGKDLINFWKEGHVIDDRDAGCVILCLTKKLDMIDPEGKLHKGKTTEFIKQHGTDEATANKVIDILHTCEANTPPNDDHCLLTLNVAKCFKKEIHALNWAPDPEVILEELMAEME